MKRAAENCPDVFQERMEPVTRIMMQYQQEQQEEKEK
jgi:hypothetical protein